MATETRQTLRSYLEARMPGDYVAIPGNALVEDFEARLPGRKYSESDIENMIKGYFAEAGYKHTPIDEVVPLHFTDAKGDTKAVNMTFVPAECRSFGDSSVLIVSVLDFG